MSHMNESRVLRISHVTYEGVKSHATESIGSRLLGYLVSMSHVNEPCRM